MSNSKLVIEIEGTNGEKWKQETLIPNAKDGADVTGLKGVEGERGPRGEIPKDVVQHTSLLGGFGYPSSFSAPYADGMTNEKVIYSRTRFELPDTLDVPPEHVILTAQTLAVGCTPEGDIVPTYLHIGEFEDYYGTLAIPLTLMISPYYKDGDTVMTKHFRKLDDSSGEIYEMCTISNQSGMYGLLPMSTEVVSHQSLTIFVQMFIRNPSE